MDEKSPSASLRLKTLLKISADSISTVNNIKLNRSSSPCSVSSLSEPELEIKAKVPFYSETLYEDLQSTSAKKSKQLLTADGSIGYGGSEFIQNIFTKDTAPEDKKYKWDVLWRTINETIRNKITCDSVSLFSVTDIVSADLMSTAILSLEGVTKDSSITDATACIGGNTFSFIKHFKYVKAIELDTNRCQILRSNLKLFKAKNVEVIQGNSLVELKSTKQSIIFFDPPWGGQKYKSRTNIELYLGGLTIGNVCEILKQTTNYFAIKLPLKKVDENRIIQESCCKYVKTVQIGKKMKLLLLKC